MLLNLHLVNPKIIKSNTMKLFNVLLFSSLLLSGTELAAEENTRWQIAPDSSIVWQGNQGIPHQDHLEMSGKTVSVVLRYGIDSQGTVPNQQKHGMAFAPHHPQQHSCQPDAAL